MKNNKGFTLAEVLIALTVLGIVASLTIPTVIQKQREAANRTKIKKSMTVYDRMFAKMIIENNLKSEQAVRDFVKTDCSNTASYFKIAESLSTENSCTFKTSDGVFWDITDIFHPIISLNKDDLDDLTSKNTFQMVTTFDPKTGAFRTNDLQYEIANNGDEEEMEKLFTFVKPEIGGAGGGENASKFASCNGENTCTIDGKNYKKYTFDGTEKECQYSWGDPLSILGSDDNCSHVAEGDLYFDETPTSTDDLVAQAEELGLNWRDGSTCEGCDDSMPDRYNLAKQYCSKQGMRLPTVAELKASGAYNGGSFWASEEYADDSNDAYSLTYRDVYDYYKDNYLPQVVCVGK